VADTRRIGPERRHGALRQLRRHQTEALEDARAGEVKVHVVLEHDVDHREPEGGLRANHADTGQALQIHRERVADLVFHLLRTVALPVREHDHLVV